MSLQPILDDVYQRTRGAGRGRVADYIPELAEANRDDFAIVACSTNGEIHSAGDTHQLFTIQSVCKPMLYAAALAEFGSQRVHARVGVEPSGLKFNSFTRLAADTKRPQNPMINPGAIAVADLLIGGARDQQDPPSRLRQLVARFVGRQAVEVDQAVFQSERSHASRNRVIAYLMKHFSMILSDVEPLLDCYFQVCSIRVDCRDLAVAAACLASAGRHPISGEQVVPPHVVPSVLTVMTTCGMYDSSGRYARDTGLPSKSGVSGAILAAVPGRMGIAVYSPPLDSTGNSVRGQAALRRLQSRLRLHTFAPLRSRALPQNSVQKTLERLAEQTGAQSGGQPARYLPAVDADRFGVALCTVQGEMFSAGDSQVRFSLQAAANPLAYGSALSKFGTSALRRIVGVEPSGNPFHAILINERSRRPYNPLGNAGAIAVAGLHAANWDGSGEHPLLAQWSAFAGEDSGLRLDPAVLECERAAGNRNRAIANLLAELNVLAEVEQALEWYFRQCSVLVNCRELARIGAMLAAGGRRPGGGPSLLSPQIVREVITVMYTCGMHDQSGQFAMDVGIPAKSGISGGILAVVPGRFGIGVYAPRVDLAGTSVRGRRALRELAQQLKASVFPTGIDGK